MTTVHLNTYRDMTPYLGKKLRLNFQVEPGFTAVYEGIVFRHASGFKVVDAETGDVKLWAQMPPPPKMHIFSTGPLKIVFGGRNV